MHAHICPLIRMRIVRITCSQDPDSAAMDDAVTIARFDLMLVIIGFICCVAHSVKLYYILKVGS